MARSIPRLDAWPLLPRPLPDGAERSADEPARAAMAAVVGLAAVILALRLALTDGALAQEFTILVALIACKGSFAVTASLLIMMFAAALISPLPMHPELRRMALAAFDHGIHLALVLTLCGVLALLVLSGSVSRIAVMFLLQAMLLMGCHRTRLWFARRRAAQR